MRARVLELLAASENPEARAAGEALAVWAGSGIGRLAFSADQHADAAARSPVTTIKARGLSLPSPASRGPTTTRPNGSASPP